MRVTCLIVLLALTGCVSDKSPPVAARADARVDAAPGDAAWIGDALVIDAATADAEPGDALLLPADAAAPSDAAPPFDAALPSDAAPPGDAAPIDAAPPVDAALGDAAPPACEAVGDCADPPVVEHRVAARPGCVFRLARQGDPAAARALAAEIAGRTRGVVPFTAIDLNRAARDGITADAAQRLRNHPYEGFRWNDGDMGTDLWYPQGITGISDSRPAADAPARRLFVVSWYDHRDARPTKGVRISLVDYSDPANIGYRHLLLVVPTRVDGAATFEAVTTSSGGPLHAGGIVWYGDLLFVADTTQGFRVFDLASVIEVDSFDRDRVGVAPDGVHAHAYRYIVPQIARYRLTDESCPIRFSFAGLDRSAEPPQIVTGEYRSDDIGGRIARWPVGRDGWLQARDGVVSATDAVVAAQSRMQGGLTWGGDLFISSSSQAGRLGRLYRTRIGREESSISAWVYGCEDLYYERHTDRIWTAAEHPDARDVVSIRRLAP